MGQDGSWQSLTQFYDAHTINEASIHIRLQDQGIPLETLTEDILKEYDMDHHDGIEAIDVLAQKSGIDASSYVLDVCCGIGGPARYLAHTYGCRVTGIDLTESRIQSARRFTALVELDHLVDFRLGNALEMPFDDKTFDVVIGQEAWVHVPDKARLLRECTRVLKTGGMVTFTDFLQGAPIQPSEWDEWREQWGGYAEPETAQGYSRLLTEAGLTLLEHEDLSAHWTDIKVQQHERWQQRHAELTQEVGAERYRQNYERYRFMADMFATGKVGGGRFVARLDTK